MHVFARLGTDLYAQSLIMDQNFCIRAQEEVYEECTVGWVCCLEKLDHNVFLPYVGVSWFRRKRHLHFPPCLSVEEDGDRGRLVFKADNCKERSLVLGEEHVEVLPNGESAKVTVESVCATKKTCNTKYNQDVTFDVFDYNQDVTWNMFDLGNFFKFWQNLRVCATRW